MTSLFQPLFSIAHRRAVGYETLSGLPGMPGEIASRAPEGWLFVNLRAPPDCAAGLGALLEASGTPPHRVVAEFAASAAGGNGAVLETVAACRALGCLASLDGFGAANTDFSLVWRAKPDFVKIDAALIGAALEEPGAQRKLAGIVSLLHDSGALVCVERVERREEVVVAIAAGTDFVQGRYFGVPAARIEEPSVSATVFDALAAEARRRAAEEDLRAQAQIEPYLRGIRSAAALLACGAPFEEAAQQLLVLGAAERCFLLDGEGHQMGRNLVSLRNASAADPRFAPLTDVSGASWETREYFRRAIAQPERVQVTRPYLSLTGPQNCITLSVVVRMVGGTRVLCADVNADTLAHPRALESAHAGAA